MAKSVLIADDNPVIRKMLCQMFECEQDYDLCAEACNGEEAISLALKHKPDVIVLDVSMPVMDGLTAARKLKEMMPELPIILLTQHAGSRALMLAKPEVDVILAKSDGATLLDRIRSVVPV